MGKLGDCIRGTDYVGTKRTSEYSRSSDEPRQYLRDIENEYENGGLTLEDLQDAYWAFGEKVGVPNYPELRTPAFDLAEETVKILIRLTSEFLKNHGDLQSKIAEIVFHTMISLFKAGLGPTHCEMIEELNKFKKILKPYVQTFNRQQLVEVLALTKVSFKITSNEALDTKHGDMQRDSIKIILLTISTKQCAEVQKEFLEVYRHYMVQLPVISGNHNYCLKMNYLTDEMLANFEKENPYLHLKNPDIVKDHVTLAKNIIFHENYVHDGPMYSATRKMLQKIMEAISEDGIVADVFDHLINVLIEIINTHRSLKEAKEIFHVYSYYLFELAVEKTPVQQIYKSSINMCLMLLSNSEKLMQSKIQEILCRAIENVIMKVKKLPDEDVQNCLKIMIQMLQSGRLKLVDVCERFLQSLKKSKSLDWKKHLEEARQMIDIVGTIPAKKMQADKDTKISQVVSEYSDFIEELLEQLQLKKLYRELTETIIDCLFNCLAKDPPLKKRIAEEGTCKVSLEFKDKRLRVKVLKKFEDLVKQEDFPWEGWMMSRPMRRMLDYVIKSFQSGEDVTPEENAIFMSIFKTVSDDGDSVDDVFYEDIDATNWRMEIFHDVLQNYVQLHSSPKTVANLLPIMPNVFRWARIAVEEEHERMTRVTFGYISSIGQAACPEIKQILPEIVDLLLETKNTGDLFACVSALYPYNPEAIHSRLDEFFDSLEDSDEDAQRHFAWILNTVASKHPEIFKKDHIEKMFVRYQEGYDQEKILVLMIFKAISEKHPSRFKDFFSKLCDDSVFKTDVTTMSMRCGIITCVGGVDKVLGERAVDYLMKYVASTDQTTAFTTAGSLRSVVKKHQDYMQKYKTKLMNAEKKATSPQLKDIIHDIILVLEGKSVEHIAEDVQQQQEDMAVLDEKVDVTIDTVVKVGEKVVEHDKEIGELAGGLERVEERVDDVEEDLGETKIKVEDIDNKTMSNAPKWSRDLTKLMNPVADNDWRLLGSRLGYSNDDIRGWATQHDPCMALLSEWYATHKTSEASHAVLTALTEMNRMDGAVIVENAMKAAEGVVEDEEFEYPSPPPVFISYQWGFQNEVKLLKQHLNMAGYECWMDVGQMGGGDKLFAKIDNGIRGAKVVICCTTEKYAQSPNCNREVNLSVNLNKPIIPLLMEKMDWPPKGSMGPIFSEYLFIRFFQRDGEETGTKDKRYWPIPKFQELLMQLNFFVVPDQKLVKKEYANWWTPITEDITVDKNKGKKQTPSQKPKTDKSQQVVKAEKSPLVFLSYQWGKQPQVKALYQRLTSLGYTVWMDIYQMGGGDSLYDKIDRGIRGCRVVVSCVTQKYSLSANCRREVSLADALKKPMVPLLLEQMKWPPDGPMSMMFTELLFINFYRDETIQMTWKGEKFDELLGKLSEVVPNVNGSSEKKDQSTAKSVKTSGDSNNKAEKQGTKGNNADASLNTSNDAKMKGRAGTGSNKTSAAVKRTETPNRIQGTDSKETKGKNQDNDVRSTETNTEKDTSAIRPGHRKAPNNNEKESITSNSNLETPHSRAVQPNTKGSSVVSKPIPRNRATSANTERDTSAIRPGPRKAPNNNEKESITSNSNLETPHSPAVQLSTKGSAVVSKPIPRNRATSAKTPGGDLKTVDVHIAANQLRKNEANHNTTATLQQKTIESASASHNKQSGERSISNVQAEKTVDTHTDVYSEKRNDTDAVQLNRITSEHSNKSNLKAGTMEHAPASQSKNEANHNNTATLQQKTIDSASASHNEQSGERSTSKIQAEKIADNHTDIYSGKHNDTNAVHSNKSNLQPGTIEHVPASQSKQERFVDRQGNTSSEVGNKIPVVRQEDRKVHNRHPGSVKAPVNSPSKQPQSKSCTIL